MQETVYCLYVLWYWELSEQQAVWGGDTEVKVGSITHEEHTDSGLHELRLTGPPQDKEFVKGLCSSNTQHNNVLLCVWRHTRKHEFLVDLDIKQVLLDLWHWDVDLLLYILYLFKHGPRVTCVSFIIFSLCQAAGVMTFIYCTLAQCGCLKGLINKAGLDFIRLD